MDIPVVTTWRQLASLPALRLADGSGVRVGIQTQAAPVGSGVAIFVLAEQRRDEQSPVIDETSCGPVRVSWTHSAPVPSLSRVELAYALQSLHPGMHLHTRVIPMIHTGTYTVQVRDQDERVMATTTVTATTAAYHRWSSLRRAPRMLAHEPQLQDDEGWDCDLDIVAGPGHAVTAAGSGGPSWMWLERDHHENVMTGKAADVALPSADPLQVDQRITIAATRTAVTVFVPAVCQLPIMIGATADDQILFRWWRNGEPWQPGIQEAIAMAGFGAHSIAEGDLRLRFAIEPGSLPEDERIEVQLLICTTGGVSVTEEVEMLATPIVEVPSGRPPMVLTPRCEVR